MSVSMSKRWNERACDKSRMVTVSSLGFNAGDTNLYRYVGNSPTDATDPTGLIKDDEAIKGTDSGVMKIIDGMKNLTPQEKEKIKKEIQLLLDASRFDWPERTGFFGKCKDWVKKYEVDNSKLLTRLEKEMKQYFQVKPMFWQSNPGFWAGFLDGLGGFGSASYAWRKVDPGHAAIQITFADGTILYLDDSNLGGVDHVFLPTEIPSNYSPMPGFPLPVTFKK